MLEGSRVLLIVAGGIAAYKALELARRLRERGARVDVVLTNAGARFVTPLSFAAITHAPVHDDLFALTDEAEMGHLALAREADVVAVAPATADLLARMAAGLADDLATTLLLATRAPVLVAPAMNTAMWAHPATVANLALLERRGIHRIGPESGPLAEDTSGMGRMAEPTAIVEAVEALLGVGNRLAGRRALVTSGPTWEAIDPVRFLANRSSGKQGHAIAAALQRSGAEVTLVSGPTALPDPPLVTVVRVESARQMLAACEGALPVDVAVCAAAVADWRPATVPGEKIKKNGPPPPLALTENPDVLAALARANRRPALVVGFAAETSDVVAQAIAKRKRKGCDWIVANDVSPGTGTFGGDETRVHLITNLGVEDWPPMTKIAVAERLVERIAAALEG